MHLSASPTVYSLLPTCLLPVRLPVLGGALWLVALCRDLRTPPVGVP